MIATATRTTVTQRIRAPPIRAGFSRLRRIDRLCHHASLLSPQAPELGSAAYATAAMRKENYQVFAGGKHSAATAMRSPSVSPGTALMGRDARSDRSRGGPLRSLGNRETEPFGEAGVAPVIHVQPIRRYEPFERQMFILVPMPHQIEAAKMINALLLRGGGSQRHNVVYMSLGDDPGNILRINQHDVGASRLKTCQSLAQPRCLRLHGFAVQH